MGAMKATIGDALITFVWMFCVSTLGAFTSFISSALQLHGVASMLGITTAFIGAIVLVFDIIANALEGASFNPTANASFYTAGLGGESLFSMALRFPAQAAGAVAGVLVIMEFMPSLKVDLHTGAVAEGVLTFLITFAVLWIVIKGPGSSIVKTWMLAVTTVALIVTGSGYTGPSMNPANGMLGRTNLWSATSSASGTGEPWRITGSPAKKGCRRLARKLQAMPQMRPGGRPRGLLPTRSPDETRSRLCGAADEPSPPLPLSTPPDNW